MTRVRCDGMMCCARLKRETTEGGELFGAANTDVTHGTLCPYMSIITTECPLAPHCPPCVAEPRRSDEIDASIRLLLEDHPDAAECDCPDDFAESDCTEGDCTDNM